jgi:hypothetical protein
MGRSSRSLALAAGTVAAVLAAVAAEADDKTLGSFAGHFDLTSTEAPRLRELGSRGGRPLDDRALRLRSFLPGARRGRRALTSRDALERRVRPGDDVAVEDEDRLLTTGEEPGVGQGRFEPRKAAEGHGPLLPGRSALTLVFDESTGE